MKNRPWPAEVIVTPNFDQDDIEVETNDQEPENERPAKNPDILLSRKAGILWICGVAAVSAWMFFLGVMVGRGICPVRFDVEELQQQWSTFQEEMLRKEMTESKIEGQTVKKQELEFYETLTDKKTEANKSDLSSIAIYNKPSPLPKVGSLTIQVSSLKNAAAADKVIHELQKKGYDTYADTVDIPERGMWHRVCVGQFASHEDADKICQRLRQSEHFDPIIIKTSRTIPKTVDLPVNPTPLNPPLSGGKPLSEQLGLRTNGEIGPKAKP
ncbi:MAG: SPOR domain-containing protein [Pseudomonadota bacterium]